MNEVLTDTFVGGRAYGDVANALLRARMDPNRYRPWVEDDGRAYLMSTKIENGKLVPCAVPVSSMATLQNAGDATLRRDEWELIDREVVKVIKDNLNLVNIIKAIGTFKLPNGMGSTVMSWQRSTDIGPAVMSMDGMRRSDDDDIEYDTVYMPIPLFHKDFSYSLRELDTSRNGGPGIDLTMTQEAAEKVAVAFEQQFAGTVTGQTYGPSGSTVYGLMTHPDRQLKVLTAPSAGGWEGEDTFNEVLDMIQKAKDEGFDGPYDLIYSRNWFQYLHRQFSATKSEGTLLDKLNTIPEIRGNIKESHSVTDGTKFVMILIHKAPKVIRAVNALAVRTIQWGSHGGWRQHFKVVGSVLPQIRSTITGQCGIVHGSSA